MTPERASHSAHCFFKLRSSRVCSARSANPLATEVNSLPVRTRSTPKRVSKILRTAGTNEVPPVRNTRSTARASTPHDASSPSTHCSCFVSSSAIQLSNSARVTAMRSSSPPSRKRNSARSLLRELELHPLHRLMQLISQVFVHQHNQRLDLLRLQRPPRAPFSSSITARVRRNDR